VDWKKLGKAAQEALEQGKKSASALEHAEVDAETFAKKIKEVVGNENPMFKANITPYSADEYAKFKTYLSPDAKSGYAVKPDGELISVFSLEKGRGEKLLDDAVLNKGAQKLDAYDMGGKLPKLYGKYFDETSRLKFDPQYAPADWDATKLGKPDVVMMQLSPEKVKAQKTLKEVRELGAGEWTKLPLEKREQYLNALKDTYGDSAVRSKTSGHVTDTFHGTEYDKPIEVFNSSKAKSGQLYGKGTYTTTDPKQADIYTQILDQDSGVPLEEASGSIYPLKIKSQKPFDVDNVAPKDLEKLKKALKISEDISPRYIGSRQGVTPEKFTKELKKLGYDSVKDGDVVNVLDANQVRSKNAAFDPYFKDSDNIMAAKEAKPSTFSKALELLQKPQKIASQKVAEAMGLRKADTSEENFANVADKIVDKYIVPPNSGKLANEYLAPALKAGATAAAEVFADPLSLIPIGKAANVAGKAIKGLKELPALAHIAQAGSKLKTEALQAVGKEAVRAQKLEALATALKEKATAPKVGKVIEEGPTLNYKEMNKPKAPKEGGTLDYTELLQQYRDKAKTQK
jgi:hypothetical protein